MADRSDELFARVGAPPALSAAAVERIGAGVRSRGRATAARRKQVAVAVGAVLAVNAAAFGAVLLSRRLGARAPAAAPVMTSSSTAAASPVVEAPPAAPSVDPVPTAQPVVTEVPPAPARSRLPTPREAVPAPRAQKQPETAVAEAAPKAPALSTLPAEAAALAPAVQALRQRHDGAAALVALDAYRTRFPEGELSDEAALLRARALLQLERHTEALEALEQLERRGALEPDLAAALQQLRGQAVERR